MSAPPRASGRLPNWPPGAALLAWLLAGAAVGAALGVTEPITSPTFTLVHSYDAPGKLTLHHADIYRLSTQHQVADLALAELLEYDGIVLLEWGDVVAGALGDHLVVHLESDPDDEEVRDIDISATGRSWAQRWDRLEADVRMYRC